MSTLRTVSLAGFAATAVTFGPGRMGFGLFLSEFREAFSLTSSKAGVISGMGFFGFFLGLLLAYALLAQGGPRRPVVIGLGLAATGMALVSMAPNVPLLTAGVVFAMTSAGLTWAPFNTAVHRALPDDLRPLSLSVVSTGTSIGVALAGALALWLSLSGQSWRLAWGVFAVCAGLAAVANLRALRGLKRQDATSLRDRWRDLLCHRAAPLYLVALCFGLTTAIYISFAADRIQQAGGLAGLPGHASSAAVFVAYGLFGLGGLATGRIKTALGLPTLLRGLLAISALSHLLVAVMPTAWAAVLASAGLQGIYVMMSSAVFAFWSERLFPDTPGLGFTVTLLALAIGSFVGPPAAGWIADRVGGEAMFLGAAALSGLAALVLLLVNVHERARTAEA